MATYTIIGADHKQYGSVTTENIGSWIAEGRLNAESLLRVEGEAEFRPLETFPEFADLLAAKVAALTPPPLPAEAAAGVAARTSGLAIASLVLGILGLFTWFTALIGFVLGIVALIKVKRSGGALGGGGMALAGLIVSAVAMFLIPILAAMLLPALVQAKSKEQSIYCMNNVRQLSLALRIYAKDNQDRYPAATNWCNAIRLEVGSTNVFHCPADLLGGRCSYAFNIQVASTELAKVDPSTVVIFESDSGWNASGGQELLLDKSRHRHVVVVGFADGHVESVPESQQPKLRWNP